MKLDSKAMGLWMGVVWGGVVLLVGVVNVVSGGYGASFLNGVASIYPGYEVGGMGSVIIVTLYAVVDGFIGGFLLAWLYNKFAGGAAA
ncbi:MAG: hypothetical protein ACC682_02630 [Gemmatimonadota bacterium]